MKKILLMIGLLIPFSVHANYNPEQLKKGIDGEKLFAAKQWIQAGDGMWRLDSGVDGMKVVVLHENATLSMAVENQSQLDETMQRCEKFAALGMTASVEQVAAVVRGVVKNGDPKSIELNNSVLEVQYTTIKRRKKDIFSCSLSKKG